MNYRQFYALADTNTLLRIYLTCIHPHLEYVCQLWDPQHNQGCTSHWIGTEIACKVCLLWDMNYESDLQQLDLTPLSQHCKFLILSTNV